MARVSVIAAIVIATMCGMAFGLPRKVVYRRRAECGNNQLAFAQASAECEKVGGKLATRDLLDKFITKFNLRECGPGACGWLKGDRTFAVPCDADAKKATKCQAPESGADVWCFGPPPAAVQEDLECPGGPVSDSTAHRLAIHEYEAHDGRDCSKELPSMSKTDVSNTGSSLESCLDLCNLNPECEGFTYDPTKTHCETFTYICPKFSRVADTKPDVTFYVKPRHNNGTNNIYTAYQGKMCTPREVLRAGEKPDPMAFLFMFKEWDCAKKCAAISDCTGFNFESQQDISISEGLYADVEAPQGKCYYRYGSSANCESIEPKNLYSYYEKLEAHLA